MFFFCSFFCLRRSANSNFTRFSNCEHPPLSLSPLVAEVFMVPCYCSCNQEMKSLPRSCPSIANTTAGGVCVVFLPLILCRCTCQRQNKVALQYSSLVLNINACHPHRFMLCNINLLMLTVSWGACVAPPCTCSPARLYCSCTLVLY